MKKTFCLILSFFILWSAVGFSVNAHLCGSQIVGLSLFGEAEVCEMKIEAINSSDKEEPSCCRNEEIIVEGQKHVSSKQQSKVLIKNWEVETIAIMYSSIVSLFQTESVLVYSDNYSPPEIKQEITILVQSFLL